MIIVLKIMKKYIITQILKFMTTLFFLYLIRANGPWAEKTRANDVKGECIVRRTNIHSNKNIALQLFQSASHFYIQYSS